MSRIGKIPITIPPGVDVKLENDTLTVKGPLGALSQQYRAEFINVVVEDGQIRVERLPDCKESSQYQGLYRKLFANMVEGVTNGYQKKLQIEGIGYRARIEGNELAMNVGLSYEARIPVEDGLKIEVDRNILISVSGASKEQVGRVAAAIRAVRPPEPYKGKGVRYAKEQIKHKAGKTG